MMTMMMMIMTMMMTMLMIMTTMMMMMMMMMMTGRTDVWSCEALASGNCRKASRTCLNNSGLLMLKEHYVRTCKDTTV